MFDLSFKIYIRIKHLPLDYCSLNDVIWQTSEIRTNLTDGPKQGDQTEQKESKDWAL